MRDNRFSLRRKPASREPKARFTIYCEGKNTEPAYFRALKGRYNHVLLEIKIFPDCGEPLAQLRQAEADRCKRRHGDSFEKSDQTWLVFDRDQHEHYDEVISRCRAKNIRVARSNPCFELWLILHHEDFHKSDTAQEVQAHFSKIHPEYDHRRNKMIDCTVLLDNLQTAETRAERQLQRRAEEDMPHGRPSTTVFELTRAIRKAAETAQ